MGLSVGGGKPFDESTNKAILGRKKSQRNDKKRVGRSM